MSLSSYMMYDFTSLVLHEILVANSSRSVGAVLLYSTAHTYVRAYTNTNTSTNTNTNTNTIIVLILILVLVLILILANTNTNTNTNTNRRKASRRGRVLTTTPRLLQLDLQSLTKTARMNHFNVTEQSTGNDLEILRNRAQNQYLWRKGVDDAIKGNGQKEKIRE
jgi:uncharacterized integral membrane protein